MPLKNPMFGRAASKRKNPRKPTKKRKSFDTGFGYNVTPTGGLQRQVQHVDVSAAGDYGSDPLPQPDGSTLFRMVPSGDIVGWDERQRRLTKKNPVSVRYKGHTITADSTTKRGGSKYTVQPYGVSLPTFAAAKTWVDGHIKRESAVRVNPRKKKRNPDDYRTEFARDIAAKVRAQESGYTVRVQKRNGVLAAYRVGDHVHFSGRNTTTGTVVEVMGRDYYTVKGGDGRAYTVRGSSLMRANSRCRCK